MAFRVTGTATAAVVAFVTLAVAVSYTAVRCPDCRRRVLDVPTGPDIEVRRFQGNPTGRGRTLVCPRCRSGIEVIEHG